MLGSPAWLPDGSLVYERRVLSGSNEAVRIERAQPGQPGQVLAESAFWPGVSADGTLLAMVRFSGPTACSSGRSTAARSGCWSTSPRCSRSRSRASRRTAPGSPSRRPPTRRGAERRRRRLTVGPASRGRPEPTAFWQLPLLGTVTSLLGAPPARAHGVPWDVWVVRPDGSDLRRVTSFADDDSSVAWSPDGRWLATFSAEAIHVVSFDGTETYCVTNEGGYGALEWLP